MTNPAATMSPQDLVVETRKWMCAWCQEPVFQPPYTELNRGTWRVHGKCWRPFKRRVQRQRHRDEKRTAERFRR